MHKTDKKKNNTKLSCVRNKTKTRNKKKLIHIDWTNVKNEIEPAHSLSHEESGSMFKFNTFLMEHTHWFGLRQQRWEAPSFCYSRNCQYAIEWIWAPRNL